MPNALSILVIRVFATVSLLLIASAASAQYEKPYEPARGTQERKDLMNAIRPLVEARVYPPVEFVIDRLRVSGNWAFAIVSPQRPGGKPIDLSATALRQQAEYMDGITTYALLVRAYGRWNIVDYAIGPTDVFWSGDPLYEQLTPGLVPR
jgi:hypothetical protein